MGTRARGHSKRDDVANKGDRRRSHTTRTCTDNVRGHQQKRRSETTAVREALRHRTGGQRQQPYGNGPARSACPSPAEKTARGSDSEAKATANLMAAQQLSWILRRKKNAPGSRRDGRVVRGEGGGRGWLNPVFFIFDPKTQKPNSAARPPLKSRRR